MKLALFWSSMVQFLFRTCVCTHMFKNILHAHTLYTFLAILALQYGQSFITYACTLEGRSKKSCIRGTPNLSTNVVSSTNIY